MLKRIDVSDVELGMFIHKLEGSWFKHPFWKTKFVLEDEDTLAELRCSDVPAVIIDTDRGLDLRPAPRGQSDAMPGAIGPAGGVARILAPGARRAARVAAEAGANQFDLRSAAPQPLSREFGHATRVAEKSRKVISRVFLEARLGKSIKAATIEPVVEDIFASIQRNPHAFNGLMRCKRDNEFVYRHALAVSALMISLGRQMKLHPEELRAAGTAGLLLDVGVGHLPVDLAAVDGDFRRLDERIFREHAKLGYDFMLAGGMAEPVALACLEHHERLDGAGYPNGLRDANISMFGRMAAICDTYDWLVNDGADGAGLDPAAAIERLSTDRFNGTSGAYDPAILAHFIDAMGIHPIGSVVLLASGRLAMVVMQDEADPSRPTVRTFWSSRDQRMVTPDDINLANCFGQDQIVGTADPAAHGCTDFTRLREKLFATAATGRG